MTEAEWFRCTDVRPMLALLPQQRYDRKRRLFALAWCRRRCYWLYGQPLGDPQEEDDLRRAIEVAERFVEGRATEEERAGAYQTASGWAEAMMSWDCELDYQAALAAAPLSYDADPPPQPPYYASPQTDRMLAAERAVQADLLREIVGNPIRPPAIDPYWLAHDGGAVARLARVIHADGDYTLMPILADALLDAGCNDPVILNHCRCTTPFPSPFGGHGVWGRSLRNLLELWWSLRPTPGRYVGHVRGCWLLDALLGRG